MTLYDNFINQIEAIMPESFRKFSFEKSKLNAGDKNSILLLKDTAFELGGSQKPCVSASVVSSDMKFDDCVYLYGKDLTDIKEDCCYGKIVFLEVENINEEEAFDRIKELEMLRYNYCPEGFMVRASALTFREQLRVSKKVIKNGISFKDYGCALIEQYKRNTCVKSVKIIFLTEFDRFDELYLLCDKIKKTTDALNHIFDNILFDCSTCNLKAICDEVDGMKELHMKKSEN